MQFNFFSLDEIRPFIPTGEHLINDSVVRHQLDPFFAECRAFGLLVEKNKDDSLAVRCHGYVYLSDAVEHRINQQFDITDWNRQREDEGSPLRAIVKDFIRFKTPFGRKKFSTMRGNLEKLNDLGIHNMDIREDNYKGGRLFDFSIAITSPHMSFNLHIRSREQILEDMRYDLRSFDIMEKRVLGRQTEVASSRRPRTRSQYRDTAGT
jgi:hypothetical protein